MEKIGRKQLAGSQGKSPSANLAVWRTLLAALFIAIFLAGINLLPEDFHRVKASQKKGDHFASLSSALVAQGGRVLSDRLWQPSTNASLEQRTQERQLPHSYSTIALNQNALNELLQQAPMEFTEAAKSEPVVMTLPMPNGELARFSIEESPIMHADLAAQYPEIKTYKGQGIDDPTAMTRFDWTPLGFHAIVLSAQGTVFIEPFSQTDKINYLAYFTQDISIDDLSFTCLLPETEEPRGTTDLNAPQPAFTTGPTLRKYRLAVAATGEFTQQYGGGNVANTLTQITSLVNQINAIYLKEATITFELIANETSIIFTDAGTDGYTNSNPGTMLNENQSKLDSVIGSTNYDIGHVFGGITVGPGSLSFSGIAGLGVVCTTGSEGRGASTMGGTPITHSIFVKGVAHEFAHQFNAPHSFNGTTGNCASQRSASSAYEPGAGSTLMSYSICGADNLQSQTDMYFHTGSLDRITTWAAGSGNCATQTATNNSAPTIGTLSNFTIPANTPFTLDASATDPNGDALTYVWEEYDLGAASPPNTDDGTRPIFRSFVPTTSTARTFPRLQYILNNANVPPSTYACGSSTCLTGELLPTTTRTMNYRFTARDNRAAGGGTANAGMTVSVVSSAGPFAVTQPNTAVSWAGNSNQTITWNVTNTNAAPVSTANVKISLSTDGGNTFPIVILASTPNDGSQAVTVPNNPTTQARVKVEAVGNIFFDISNVNFTITSGGPTCTFTLSSLSQSFPASAGSGSVTVTTQAGCNWTAISNAPTWLNVTSGASGTGNGTVQFSLVANGTGSIRSGTVTVAGQTFTVYQGIPFADVPVGSPFYTVIGKLSARGVTSGCGGNNYCPTAVVTREQMAAFIIRALGEFNPPTPGSQRYLDVPPSNPFYNFIERMAVLNITSGCGGNNYCPTSPVLREQMAAFIIRALGEFNPPTPGSQRFNDVPPSNPFYNFIDRMAELNITSGCGGNNYCPTAVVTREQMAAFLVSAFNL